MEIQNDGGIFMYNLLTSGGNRSICANVTSEELSMENSTTCGASSQRFKEDIATLKYGLDDVLKLQPVSFHYTEAYDAEDRRLKVGFIAEEMEQVIPEVVNYDEDGLAYNIDYPNLTAVLVSAVQELTQRVHDLEAQVQEQN